MAKGKRARTKYPALKPELNLKSRYELIDYDYVDKLSESDKAWLNKFTEEYVNASLDSENLENNFHCTDELKKDCYRRNNARNRDILTRAKASGTFVSTDELLETKKVVKIETESELFKDTANDIEYSDHTSDRPDDDGDGSDNF
jgi:hypothetical protein